MDTENVKLNATDEEIAEVNGYLDDLDSRVGTLESAAEIESTPYEGAEDEDTMTTFTGKIDNLDGRVTVLEEQSGLFGAEVDGVLYGTTAEALEAAGEKGGTIEVLQTESGEPQVIPDAITVAPGAEVTLDFSKADADGEKGELDVQRDGSVKSEGFKVEGTLTVEGGSLKNVGTSNVGIHYGVVAVEGGILNLNGTDVDGGEEDAAVVIRDGGGIVNVDADTTLTSDSYGIAKYGKDPATINVAGKVEVTGANATAISSIGGGASIVVEDTAVITSADGPAIALNAGGDALVVGSMAKAINVEGGAKLTGGQAAVAVLGGAVELNDGTFKATKEVAAGKREWLDGSAIFIQTRKPTEVTINGGTYTSDHAYALYVSKQNNSDLKLSVTGGEFTGATAAVKADAATGFISGGTFSSKPEDAWLAPCYGAREDGGKYVVEKLPVKATCDGVDYESLASALKAATDGSTVVLVAETEELDESIEISANDVTLDLTAGTVTVKCDGLTEGLKLTGKVVINGGKLVAEGSNPGEKFGVLNIAATTVELNGVTIDGGEKGSAVVFSGTGTVNVKESSYLKAALANTVNKYNPGAFAVNVYNSKIENTSGYCAVAAPAGGSVFAHLYDGAQLVSAEGSGVLSNVYGSRIDVDEGASVEGGDCGVCLLNGLLYVNGGSVSAKTAGLNGGEYKQATDTEVWCDGSAVYAEANYGSTHIYINISGGKLTSAEGYAINLAYNKLNNISLDITGGTFTGKTEKGSIHSADETITKFVKGGTFSPAVDAKFIADGFEDKEGTVVATVA